MSDLYTLDEHRNPVRYESVKEWGRMFESGERIVAKTQVGDVEVSTVFLGMDHRFGGGGPPLLFETMIFGGDHDGYCERCSTWAEAEAQHEIAVRQGTP